MLHSGIWCHTVLTYIVVLQDVIGCHTVVHRVTRCDIVLQTIARCYMVLHGVDIVLHGITQ